MAGHARRLAHRGIGSALALAVACLVVLVPARRAATVLPAAALKGGDDVRARRRALSTLIAAQVALCVLVLFLAGMFVRTFDRLSNQAIGFQAERLLALDVVAPRARPEQWDQVANHLRTLAGVERVAMMAWPLLSGQRWTPFIAIDGVAQEVVPSFLTVSPGWADVLQLAFVDGRDFRGDDTYPGVAIVNEAFARAYFDGGNPVGRWFDETPSRGNALPKEAAGTRYRVQIVGLVRDARYASVREPSPPTAYVPFKSADAAGAIAPINWGTLLVRTSESGPSAVDARASVASLRREVSRVAPAFRVTNARWQRALVDAQVARERLLATLGIFFAAVAGLLAGIGLWGVLSYSVEQRRRELAIRVALGSRASDLVWHVTAGTAIVVIAGIAAGVALSVASRRFIETLLYAVRPDDPAMLALSGAGVIVVAVLAALPVVANAVRTDPVVTLAAE